MKIDWDNVWFACIAGDTSSEAYTSREEAEAHIERTKAFLTQEYPDNSFYRKVKYEVVSYYVMRDRLLQLEMDAMNDK